jgi:hypothetical protein
MVHVIVALAAAWVVRVSVLVPDSVISFSNTVVSFTKQAVEVYTSTPLESVTVNVAEVAALSFGNVTLKLSTVIPMVGKITVADPVDAAAKTVTVTLGFKPVFIYGILISYRN